MKRSKTFKSAHKIIYLFIVVYILSAGSFTYWRYRHQSKNWEGIVRERLLTGASMIKYILPTGYFNRAIHKNSISASEYKEHTLLLSQASWESKFAHLYALKEKDGRFYYIATSISRVDIGEEKYPPYWLEDDDAPPEILKAYSTHKAIFLKKTNRLGTFYTVFLPEYSPKGELYISGADYKYDYITSVLRSILISNLLQALILLLILAIVYYSITAVQKHYIRKLQISNSIYESAPLGVLSVRANGEVEFVNDVFNGLVSIPLKGYEGMNLLSEVEIPRHDELLNNVKICLTRQISWQGEFLNPNSEGNEIWVRVLIKFTASEETGKAMMHVFASDVSHQMKARFSLAQHNKILNFLSLAINSLLANPDLEKVIPSLIKQYCQNLEKNHAALYHKHNNTYTHIASWSNSELTATNVPVNMFSDIQNPIQTNWESELEKGHIVCGITFDFPISFLTMVRIYVPGQLHLTPIFYDERYWGFFLSMQTHSERMLDTKIENNTASSFADSLGSAIKRNEIRQALIQSTEAKSNFLSSMSHEIRTPLNGVIGMINLMEATKLTSEQTEYLQAIKASGRQLMDLINNILDISRIEAGKIILRSEPVHLVNCLNTAVNIVSFELKEKNLKLEMNLAPDLPEIIEGDETRIRQIFLNLLHNAIKFTTSGTIKINARRFERDKLQFQISDTGIGMNEEQVKHIFEPFYQAGSVQQKVKGTGLGLAIIKHLITLMNGSITVKSAPNKGTTFTFILQLPFLDEQFEPVTEEIASANAKTRVNKSPLKLAFYNGNDLEDKVILNFLQKQNLKPAVFENISALELALPSSLFDLIIVNLTSQIRDSDAFNGFLDNLANAYPKIHWLFLSDSPCTEFLAGLAAQQRFFCLQKPVDYAKILQIIQKLDAGTNSENRPFVFPSPLDKH